MGKKIQKHTVPTLDLHGFSKDEVFDAIDKFLNKHQNKQHVHIMTGKGKGIVKKTTIEYLKLANYPYKSFRDSHGKVNDGVLVIFVK